MLHLKKKNVTQTMVLDLRALAQTISTSIYTIFPVNFGIGIGLTHTQEYAYCKHAIV